MYSSSDYGVVDADIIGTGHEHRADSSIYDQCDEEQLMHLLHQKRLKQKDPLRAAAAQGIEHVNRLRQRFRDGGEYRYSDLPQSDILFEQREDSLKSVIWRKFWVWTMTGIFSQLGA